MLKYLLNDGDALVGLLFFHSKDFDVLFIEFFNDIEFPFGQFIV